MTDVDYTLASRLADAGQRIAELSADLATERARVDTLQAELAEQAPALLAATTERDRYAADLTTASSDIKGLLATIDRLRNERDATRQHLETFRGALAEAATHLTDATTGLTQALTERDDTRAERDRYATILARIRALHHEDGDTCWGPATEPLPPSGYCAECDQTWPCPTTTAPNGVNSPDDELAEIHTTEDQIDAMMANGEPVQLTGPHVINVTPADLEAHRDAILGRICMTSPADLRRLEQTRKLTSEEREAREELDEIEFLLGTTTPEPPCSTPTTASATTAAPPAQPSAP